MNKGQTMLVKWIFTNIDPFNNFYMVEKEYEISARMQLVLRTEPSQFAEQQIMFNMLASTYTLSGAGECSSYRRVPFKLRD